MINCLRKGTISSRLLSRSADAVHVYRFSYCTFFETVTRAIATLLIATPRDVPFPKYNGINRLLFLEGPAHTPSLFDLPLAPPAVVP